MSDLRTAALRALEVMSDISSFERWSEVRDALKAALAEPVQEPVAKLGYTRKIEDLISQRDALLSLLGSIRGWDVLDATADGTYWKREIDAAIKAVKGEKT